MPFRARAGARAGTLRWFRAALKQIASCSSAAKRSVQRIPSGLPHVETSQRVRIGGTPLGNWPSARDSVPIAPGVGTALVQLPGDSLIKAAGAKVD